VVRCVVKCGFLTCFVASFYFIFFPCVVIAKKNVRFSKKKVCLDVKCLKIRFLSVTFSSAVDLLSNGLAFYTTDKNRLICSCLSVTFFFYVLSTK
jgi:hypothetical protein